MTFVALAAVDESLSVAAVEATDATVVWHEGAGAGAIAAYADSMLDVFGAVGADLVDVTGDEFAVVAAVTAVVAVVVGVADVVAVVVVAAAAVAAATEFAVSSAGCSSGAVVGVMFEAVVVAVVVAVAAAVVVGALVTWVVAAEPY